jgi:hypothetical protein
MKLMRRWRPGLDRRTMVEGFTTADAALLAGVPVGLRPPLLVGLGSKNGRHSLYGPTADRIWRGGLVLALTAREGDQ